MPTLDHIRFLGVDPPPVSAGALRRAPTPSQRQRDWLAGGRERSAIDPFMGWMLAQAGLDPLAYRASAMRRRLPACLRRLRVADDAEGRALLSRKPELLPLALNTILIGVSDFFRDAPVFAQLEETILPALLALPRLRICSAGASAGQELYSVAMLLAEQDALDRSELLGIDCREDAIRRARAGVYAPEELAGVASARRARFFHAESGRQVICPRLRAAARWRTADLFTLADDGPWDLVLFRNVAIYFEEGPAQKAWSVLVDRLAPGGFLVTGKAEKPSPSLPLARLAPSVYQRTA